jgi:hypothetical protein
MKKTIFSLIVVCSVFCFSAPTKSSPKNPTNTAGTTTEHNFEDMLVQGKFHFSDEAVTTVEEDKVLDSLIGVRKDFKDRLSLSTNQF